MSMPMIFWFFIVLLVFAVGDILGLKTKSLLSSTFVMLIVFLVLFLTKTIPADIIQQSGLGGISSISVYILMVDMGTMIELEQFKSEWKTVLMAVIAMVCTAIGLLLVTPIIGRESAIVSIPIINGALGATQVMVSSASEKGFAMAAALGTMIYGLQKFVGTVPAAFCGRKLAAKVVEEYRTNLANGIDLLDEMPASEGEESKPKKLTLYERAGKYMTAPVTLCIVAALSYLAYLLGKVTGVNYTVWCMILGFVAHYFGVLPTKPLTKACSAGLVMVTVFGSIIPSLADISFADLSTLGLQLILVFGASMLAIFVLIYVLPTWKLVGDRHLAFGIACCQLLGFPATMIISKEISLNYGDNEREREYIDKKLLVPYVVSGLVSVTILSVFVASFMEKML